MNYYFEVTLRTIMARNYFILVVILTVVKSQDEYDCGKFPTLQEIEDCCAVPRVIPKSIWNNCLCSPERSNVERPFCSGHCLFLEHNFIKKEDLDYPAVENFFKDFIKDNKTWSDIVETVLRTCTTSIENEDIKHLENYHCASKADFYVHCIHSNVFYNCPEEYWSPDTKCQEKKSITQNCHHPEVVAKPLTQLQN